MSFVTRCSTCGDTFATDDSRVRKCERCRSKGRIEIAREDHGKPDALKNAMERAGASNGRLSALNEAAEICRAEARREVQERDRCLGEDNHEGALTHARQAQTAEGLAKAIATLARS